MSVFVNLRAPAALTQRPPLWASLLMCLVLAALTVVLRLVVFPDRFFPLAYGLPLLLCLWNRDLRLLYGMAMVFTATVVLKVFLIMPSHETRTAYDWLGAAMQLTNIWVVSGAIHGLLRALRHIEAKNAALEQFNAELEASNSELSASNEELAAREEQIVRQNEELQSQSEELEQQAEELEQQAEELRQQTEELEQQSSELQELNQEMLRREKGMRTLLESGRWLRLDLDEPLVLNAVCQAAVQIIGEHVQAAAVIGDNAGLVALRGHWGFGVNGAMSRPLPFNRTLAELVVERGQTAFIEDITCREDIELPQPAAGRPFRSALASPIWIGGRPIATIEVYSQTPRQWTEDAFRVIEWLAGQCALALQAIRFQEELERKRSDAEEASVQKTRFLAAVSHDVRTPANAISLLADLIVRVAADPENAQEVAELATDLKNNARSLIELVSDVLDLARYDAGKLDLHATEFSLAALVQQEIKQALPLAESKGIVLRSALPPQQVWLRTDRMKLARVLSNLIGNAVKFTEIGEVEVHCEPNHDGGVELSVNDTGVGISPEHLPCVFDEFFQLRNPERDPSKGTGLGLAICGRLVEGLGCSMSVNSRVGAGTRFTVHIPDELVVPCDGIPAVPLAAHEQAGAGTLLKGLHVLLVEDHDVTRRTVAQLLAAEGAVVAQARTAREALQLLGHGPHHVMLLDLMLPDLDGREVLRSLQVDRPPELQCVLAVSGDVQASRVEEVRRLGADDLIPKPLTIERLLEALQRRFRIRPDARPKPAPRSGRNPDACHDASRN